MAEEGRQASHDPSSLRRCVCSSPSYRTRALFFCSPLFRYPFILSHDPGPQFEVLEARWLMAANAYTVVDLGSLGGGGSFATDINNVAQVVGRSLTAAQPAATRAFTWQATTGMQEFDLLAGFTHGEANALNDAGHVAGTVKNLSFSDRAVLAVPGQDPIDLGTLGGAWSRAADVNGSDTVVGVSQIGAGGTSSTSSTSSVVPSIFHAVVWQGGAMIDLGTLGGARSSAESVNDTGRVVGWSLNQADQVRAFAWQNGVMSDLGTLGGPGSAARAINGDGRIVGDADTGRRDANGFERFHAVLWDGATAIDLGSLGGPLSSAADINGGGDAVGWAQVKARGAPAGAVRHAFVWSAGSMVDLNDLIGRHSPWLLEQATAINDAGQILAFGRAAGDVSTTRAFLLEPLFADLVAEWVPRRAPQTLIPGDRIVATVRVANRGPGPSFGRTSLAVYLSKDGTLDTAADRLVHLTERLTVNFDPGDDRTVAVKMTLPGDVLPGDYQFLTRIDAQDVVDEGGLDQNITAGGQVHQVTWQFGRLASRSAATLTLEQTDHDDSSQSTKVTYSLRGPGTGEVLQNGESYDVRFSGTDHRSTATIRTVSPRGRSHVRHVDVDGSLNKLIAERTVLLGDLTVSESLNAAHLDDAIGPNRVAVGSSGRRRESVQLTFGHVEDLAIDSDIRIRSIEALHWIDKDGVVQTIEAPLIDRIEITGHRRRRLDGDFDAGVVVGNGPGSQVLGDVIVSGAISGGWWDVRGGMSSLHAGAIRFHDDVQNPIWSALVDGAIDSFTVGGSAGGVITAWSIGSLTVGQDLAHTLIRLSQAAVPPGASALALGRMNVGRWMDHVSVASKGSVGAVRAGGIRHTTIHAGVADAVTDLPATAGDFDALASINSVQVDGLRGLWPLVVDSDFAAWQIGSIDARHAASAAGRIPLRAAAHEIGMLRYRDPGEVLRLRRPADFLARVDSPNVLVRLV